MRSLILPAFLGLAGLGAGVGAGLALKPKDEAAGHPAADSGALTEEGHVADEGHSGGDEAHAEEDGSGPEYVKLNNQFVVPVVQEGRVAAMVVLSLSLEVEAGSTEAVYQREPKLRDVFLQVLFDHANVGGFSGSFTDGSNLVVLRTSLKEAAALVLGTSVKDVLITDIARQDS
jgi:flagellar protein FliL